MADLEWLIIREKMRRNFAEAQLATLKGELSETGARLYGEILTLYRQALDYQERAAYRLAVIAAERAFGEQHQEPPELRELRGFKQRVIARRDRDRQELEGGRARLADRKEQDLEWLRDKRVEMARWLAEQRAELAEQQAELARQAAAYQPSPIFKYASVRTPPDESVIALLYRLWGPDESLKYVGISGRLWGMHRVREHSRDKDWFVPEVAVATFERVPARLARDLEAMAIRTERPKYNIVHSRTRGQP